MGPNRRAQERERAAARVAEDAKLAAAAAKAIAEAQKIVAIWNARQAGGQELWFYPTIGAAIAAGLSVAELLMPSLSASRRGRSAHARSAPWRVDIELDPVGILSAVCAQCAVRKS